MSEQSRRIQAEINASKRFQERLESLADRVKRFREAFFDLTDLQEHQQLGEIESTIRKMAQQRQGSR